jgi:putative transposase
VPKAYPFEFRRALDLVGSGRTVGEVAASLGSPSRICSVQELENEVKILRTAAAAVEQMVPPKGRLQLVADWSMTVSMPSGLGAGSRCPARALMSGAPTPSRRAIRHVWLSDRTTAVHEASHRT